VALYLCHRYRGRKLKEIVARYGVTESAVTQAIRQAAESLKYLPLRNVIAEREKALDVPGA
jgi:DNA-directed RNA polymerase specialized sigma subunit